MDYITEAQVNKYKEDINWINGVYKGTSNIKDKDSSYIDTSNLFNNAKTLDQYTNALIKAVSENKSNSNQSIVIPLDPWFEQYGYTSISVNGDAIFKEKNISPVSAIYKMLKENPSKFKRVFSNIKFYFILGDACFILDTNTVGSTTYRTFRDIILASYKPGGPAQPSTEVKKTKNLDTLLNVEKKEAEENPVNPMKLPENDQRTILNTKEIELEIMEIVNNIVNTASSEEEANKMMQEDMRLKELLAQVQANNMSNINTSSAMVNMNKMRSRRMQGLNADFMNLQVNGKTVRDMMKDKVEEDIPETSLKIDSINDEWKKLKYINFEKKYDLDSDIVKCIYHFTKTSYPISIRNIKVEDTSTTEDYVNTYTVECEDYTGKRFTLKFDVPLFINNRFMKLGGNEKIINGQLLLLPCIKTDNDTAQLVSNYNKVFVRRYGMVGRSYSSSDRLIKALKKANGKVKDLKITTGNNSKICMKYSLYADYIDLASNFSEIKTKDFDFIFNQDFYRQIDPTLDNKKLPIYLHMESNTMSIYDDSKNNQPVSTVIAQILCEQSPEFKKIYEATVKANKMVYSQASILKNRMPVIVILGYLLGLTNTLKKAGIKYKFIDKKISKSNNDSELKVMSNPDLYDNIKFNDGYLYYEQTYESSMLMNGLFDCDTENYSFSEVDNRKFWLDQLDLFGGRLLSDGLDNFMDLFMDPMTEEVCNKFKLPTDFCGLLLYASDLLVDTAYNKHTDITGNRYRTNEIVAGYVYKELASAYGKYKLSIKHGRKEPMNIKQNAILLAVMTDSMSSDLSTMTPLLEKESANTVSFKGLSGMNSDRSYSLDKRTFDDSMINKLGLSTGFAGNVGITRQATIDMDIEGERGYVKNSSLNDVSDAKTMSATEAMTPFGTTRDDPFRSAMTFVQTSKHSMRTKGSAPLLITNGADDALPYMIGNTFAFKAKDNGKVVELVENEYMILEYNNGDHDYVDLSVIVKKNSDGGIYVTVQLKPDKKLGAKFSKGEVVAHDPLSFSTKYGATDELSYNIGTLAKVGILATDEGFEDSTIISEWLSEAMTSDVTMMDDVVLDANANIYYIAKPGQKVQEGDTLLLFQNAFTEEEQNALLRNITDPDLVNDLGRIKKTSHYTGVVQDIKIYRTKPISYYSKSIQKVITDYENRYKKKIEEYDKYGITGIRKEVNNYELPNTGKLKNVGDGILIEIYIMYEDKFSIGDKNVAQSACKGVCKDIFPAGKEPWSEYRPEEKIHAFYAINSFMGRMITSVLVSGAINKGLIELDRQVKGIMGYKWKTLEEMQLPLNKK